MQVFKKIIPSDVIEIEIEYSKFLVRVTEISLLSNYQMIITCVLEDLSVYKIKTIEPESSGYLISRDSTEAEEEYASEIDLCFLDAPFLPFLANTSIAYNYLYIASSSPSSIQMMFSDSDQAEYFDKRILLNKNTAIGKVLSFENKGFVSNFFEHLHSKEELIQMLGFCYDHLNPQGSLLIIQPNFKYSAMEYYDFIDHYLPITHLSLKEILLVIGYRIDVLIPRFLPFTTKGRPASPELLKIYLKMKINCKN